MLSARAAVWGPCRVGTSSSTRGRLPPIPIQFTVLIDGAIGPEPHPNFIGVLGGVAVGRGEGEVEGAGKDGTDVTGRAY